MLSLATQEEDCRDAGKGCGHHADHKCGVESISCCGRIVKPCGIDDGELTLVVGNGIGVRSFDLFNGPNDFLALVKYRYLNGLLPVFLDNDLKDIAVRLAVLVQLYGNLVGTNFLGIVIIYPNCGDNKLCCFFLSYNKAQR